MLRFHILIFGCLFLAGCSSVAVGPAGIAGVKDLSSSGKQFYYESKNRVTGKVYTGWSNRNLRHAKVNALRQCHSDTDQLNVCRLRKETP